MTETEQQAIWQTSIEQAKADKTTQHNAPYLVRPTEIIRDMRLLSSDVGLTTHIRHTFYALLSGDKQQAATSLVNACAILGIDTEPVKP